MTRLLQLYRRTNGGHKLLSESEFLEYSELRKEEYKARKSELEKEGKSNVKVCKDEAGDIIGWSFMERVNG